MTQNNKNSPPQNNELSAQSLEYLGLSKQPFAHEILTQDSFFSHQALSKITDSLTHQIQFSDLLLLVEGPHGAGKTSLYRQFIQTEIANTKTLSMQAEATDTLLQIKQSLSIHLQDLGDANHLDENLKSLQMFDQTPLVVINNSHVLSDTTLQELFRFQQQLKQDFEVNLKILLFANSGMTDTLTKITDLQSDQLYVQSLPQLSPKQAESFVMHRLRNANYNGDPLLKSEDILHLVKDNNGTPLDVMNSAAPLINNIIADQLTPKQPAWKKVLVAGSVIMALAASAYIAFIYVDQTPLHSDRPLETMAESVEKDVDVLSNETDAIDVLENDTISDDHNLTDNTSVEIASLNMNSDIETNTTELLPLDSSADAKKQPPEIVHQVINEPKVETETIVENRPQTNKIQAPIPPPLHPALQQLNTMGLHNTLWLQQQNSHNWSLQLLGAREPQTLLKFVQRNKLSTETAWYKTWLSAKPYYVLVYGSYSSRSAARNAIAGLPKKLRSLKPWVKSMKSIQKSLN